ncbi:MAG: two-component sensor histidine kinase, partial [Proteobacteria bacterium]|nr:two-component sensor histidine kinase [Pseudomonadota bacterium]
MQKNARWGAESHIMEHHHYRATRLKILASMCLVPLVPFVLAFWVGFSYFTNSVRNNTIAKMERIVNDHALMIETYLAERRADLRFVADFSDFVTLSDTRVLVDVLARLQEKSNAFVDLGVFDQTGLHVAYVGPYELAGRDYGKETWFGEVLQTGTFVSDIYLGFRGVPHFVLARAQMEDGHIWVLRSTIDTLLFSDVVERVRIGRTGEAYILNREGLFQTRRRSGGDLMEADPDAETLLSGREGSSAFFHTDGSGEKYVYVTTWIIDGKWLLVVRQSASDAFSALHRAGIWVLVIAVLGGGIIVVTAFYVSGRMVKRLEHTDQEKGELNQQLVMAGRLAEIGEMSSGFAHEINNPLQIIRAETALMET